MTDDSSSGKLHIDSDWKEEAAREKEQLAAKDRAESPVAGPGPSETQVTGFIELVNILVMQAALMLGGMQGPDGEQIPANPAGAKHMIDLLSVLEQKTTGNLSDDEKHVLDTALHELRMQFVETFGKTPPPGSSNG